MSDQCKHEWASRSEHEVCGACQIIRYGAEHVRELEAALEAARVELEENEGVMRVLRRHRTEAEDALRQAVAGLPKCEHPFMDRVALVGEESCAHVAMQSQRLGRGGSRRLACRDHAGGRRATEVSDLPWADAVRKLAEIDKVEPVIRFVDLTPSYWTDPSEGKPCCAFLDTYDDKFLTNSVGSHMFYDEDELSDLGAMAGRCRGLVPAHFWDPPERGPGISSTVSQRSALAARLVDLLEPMPVQHRLGILVNAVIVLCERQGLDPRSVMRNTALHYDDDR